MISKQYIKDLEFKTVEDVFNYIVDSKINGNYSQVKELIKKLSNDQFKLFCEWFNNENNSNDLNFYINVRID